MNSRTVFSSKPRRFKTLARHQALLLFALSMSLILTFLFTTNAQEEGHFRRSRPPCDGGTSVWTTSPVQRVGCMFPKWGPDERSLCGAYVFVNTPGSGSCFVCVEQAYVAQIQSGNWSGLKVGSDAASAVPADFTCALCAKPPANMVAWYPFNEKSGSEAADLAISSVNSLSFMYANAARLYGDPQHLVPALVKNGLCFDGVNDYAEAPAQPQIDIGAGDFSIDFWIKTTDKTGSLAILDKRQVSPIKGYHLALLGGTVWLQLADGAPTRNFANYSSNIAVADGKWHFVALTVNRATKKVQWYTAPPTPGTLSTITQTGSLSNNVNLQIGRRSAALGDPGWFKGCLDELEIYNRVLTSAEVASIFKANKSGKCK